MADTRSQVQQLARVYQYQLHPQALKQILEYVSDWAGGDGDDYDTRQELLRSLFAALQEGGSRDRFIDRARVDAVIERQRAHRSALVGGERRAPAVQVVPLASVPRVAVDEVSGEARIVPEDRAAAGRLGVLRQRYLLARRRCLRSGLYRREAAAQTSEEAVALLPTTALEGLRGTEEVAVLGALFRRPDGRLVLEDPRGVVELRGAPAASGCFFCPGFLAVARGHWRGGWLHVRSLLPPPTAPRERAQRDLGLRAADAYGLAPPDAAAALAQERQAARSVVVCLAHVHLDLPRTWARLAAFLDRMEARSDDELAETTLVLVGDFCALPAAYADATHLPPAPGAAGGGGSSSSGGGGGGGAFAGLMDALAEHITTHAPRSAQLSHFVLVPGPHDLTALQGVVPQPPLAEALCAGLRGRLRRLTLAPNPCRLRFFTHEIIVSRRNYLAAFQRGERQLLLERGAEGESENEEEGHQHQQGSSSGAGGGRATTFDRVCRSVVDQAHLAPEELGAVLWRLDDALRLPLPPRTLLLCDATEQWECVYAGVRVVNPGSFTVGATFLWLTPSDGEYTLSSLH